MGRRNSGIEMAERRMRAWSCVLPMPSLADGHRGPVQCAPARMLPTTQGGGSFWLEAGSCSLT